MLEEKKHNQRFLKGFRGASTFLTPKLPCAALKTTWGQKSLGPSKKLQKSPMVCFARIKK
jgi:hypothetical protein